MELIKNKKVLVTGGAGFIGSHLCHELISLNNEVVCLDNFSNGSFRNISKLLEEDNFELIEGDIRHIRDCVKACDGVDVVFHNAALGSIPRSFENQIETNEVNVSGFLNMLEASKHCSVERFIYASSSSVYGDNNDLPKVENVIGNQLSPYAITKYVNELYANISELDVIGLRYFNVFGERQCYKTDYPAVIPSMMNDAFKYGHINVNGDGENTRDFTYVQNVVNMNIISASTKNRDALNQVYNVGCNSSIKINFLASYISNMINIKNSMHIPIYNINSRIGDVRHSLASIDKAKNLLGYFPYWKFHHGLDKAFEYYYKELYGKV